MKRLSPLRVVLVTSTLCVLLILEGPARAEPAAEASALGASIQAAEQALRVGEPQLAESRYRDALQQAWLLLGACDALDDDLEGADDAFRRAAAAALPQRAATIARAAVELQRGEAASASAVQRLRQLLTRRPDDLPLRRLLARALSAVGDDAGAVQELAEAHAAAPDDAELAFALATGQLRLGAVDEAERLLDQVLAARPGPEAWVLVGRTWRDFEHYGPARAALEQALALDPTTPKAHFYLGTIDLLDQGRGLLDAAIERFEAELELSPDDPLAHLFLGLALVETRRFAAALPHFEQAMHAPGSRVDALHSRGRALLGLRRHTEAEDALRQALDAADPTSTSPSQLASLHYQLALALRALGRDDDARPHFDAAREQTAALGEESRERMRRYLGDETTSARARAPLPIPTAGLDRLPAAARDEACRNVAVTATRAHLNLGVLQARVGRHARAAHQFTDALAATRHRPTMADAAELATLADQARYALGVAWFSAGRHDAARAPLEAAWERAGTAPSSELRRLLAMTRLETGDPAGAATLLDDDPAVREPGAANPVPPSLLFAYGKALVRADRVDEALAVFDRLAALVQDEKGENPELLVLFAEASARDGDWPRAEETLQRALALDPDVAGAHRSLGEIHLRRGALELAVSALDQAVARHPDDLRARLLYATVLDLRDEHDAAEAQIRHVVAARPDDADARYLLGKILLGRGDAAPAAAQLEAAAAAEPDDFTIHYQLGLAYQRLGRRDAARACFDTYRRLKGRDPVEAER
ncbi:MAG: tetratricopeptide repeat protein [Acidobacteriota bacterium]